MSRIVFCRFTWFVDGHLRHDCGGRQRWRRIVAEYVLGFELGRLSDRYGRRVSHGGHRCRGHHQRGHGQHSGGRRVSGNVGRERRRAWMILNDEHSSDVRLCSGYYGSSCLVSPPFRRHGWLNSCTYSNLWYNRDTRDNRSDDAGLRASVATPANTVPAIWWLQLC